MTDETILPAQDARANLGPLAAALAKAQSEFGAVTKDKTVTVQTKSGGSYSFKYAPLDQILNVVKGPLTKNGLALVQLLDSDALVTMLIHESGATLEAHTPLPESGDVQGYGSAITYLRRYAVQAMLGIAAEDDDDGNRAAGNQVATDLTRPPSPEKDGLNGTAEVGKASTSDWQLRMGPDGALLGFRLTQGRKGFNVLTRDELAMQMLDFKDDIVDQRVTVWGRVVDETFTPNKPNAKPITYQIVHADRIQTPKGILPVIPQRDPEQELVDTIPIAAGQQGFDLVESGRIDAEEAAKA